MKTILGYTNVWGIAPGETLKVMVSTYVLSAIEPSWFASSVETNTPTMISIVKKNLMHRSAVSIEAGYSRLTADHMQW